MRDHFVSKFREAIHGVGERESAIIEGQFLHKYIKYKRLLMAFTVARIILANTVTIGSVLVTAFMTIEHMDWLGGEARMTIFWIGWVLSLIVVVASKIGSVFEVDKKCVVYANLVRAYEMEGWKFATRYTCGQTNIAPFTDRINKVEASAGRSIGSRETHIVDSPESKIEIV